MAHSYQLVATNIKKEALAVFKSFFRSENFRAQIQLQLTSFERFAKFDYTSCGCYTLLSNTFVEN